MVSGRLDPQLLGEAGRPLDRAGFWHSRAEHGKRGDGPKYRNEDQRAPPAGVFADEDPEGDAEDDGTRKTGGDDRQDLPTIVGRTERRCERIGGRGDKPSCECRNNARCQKATKRW